MYNSLTYGNVIKELRNDRFLSQGELAEDICSQGMLSRIENNDVVPNVLVMQKICERLNVSVNYVLTLEESKMKPENNWLELLKQYKQSKQFAELADTLTQIEEDQIVISHSKVELQEYAYYRGASLIDHNHKSEKGLAALQEGLNYTYNRNKANTTDMEVVLLSKIGKVYYYQGKYELGLSFMRRSISQFYADMSNRVKIDTTKIFYNIATALIDLKSYDEAIEFIEQGILWSQKLKTFYCLDDLYMLKGIVYQDLGRMDEAIEVAQIAETLSALATQAV